MATAIFSSTILPNLGQFTVAEDARGILWVGTESSQDIGKIANKLKTHGNFSDTVPCGAGQGENAIVQLQEYGAGTRKQFSLALELMGTPFQKTVWQALREVPYGTTLSYKDLAKRVGMPKAARAVAKAVGANPFLILVPCHRIIGSDGSLTGFRAGLELKKKLLALEGVSL